MLRLDCWTLQVQPHEGILGLHGEAVQHESAPGDREDDDGEAEDDMDAAVSARVDSLYKSAGVVFPAELM